MSLGRLRDGSPSDRAGESGLTRLKLTEKIMPAVALWLEAAFTLDPFALQLRLYAVTPYAAGTTLFPSGMEVLWFVC